MPTKPQKKRLRPRPLVEAERDARDVVRIVLSVVLDAHASRWPQEQLRALTQGRDPLAPLRAAIARGARGAAAAVGRPGIPFREWARREALKRVKKREPKELRAALASERDLKAWALHRMDELVNPPPLFGDGDNTPSADPLPVRQAALSVAAELGDNPNADQIRAWWRRARKK